MRARSKILSLSAIVWTWLVTPAALGQGVVNTFDSASEVPGSWVQAGGDATLVSLTFDDTKDAGGTAAAGSMKVVAHFIGAAATSKIVLGRPIALGDMSSYTSLDMDVYIDSTSAKRTSTGDHGYLTVGYFFNSFTQVTQPEWKPATTAATKFGGNISGFNDDAWYHISIPLAQFKDYAGNPSSASNVQGIGLDLLGGKTMIGDVTFWIDNIRFIPPPTEPLILNQFNDPVEGDQWVLADWGVPIASRTVENGEMKVVASHSSTTDCDACAGDQHTGECTSPEDPPDYGCNSAWLTKSLPMVGGVGMDLRGYGSFEADVHVDLGPQNEGSSLLIEFGPRSGETWAYNHTGIRASGVNSYHVSIPMNTFGLTNLRDVRGWTIQLWGNDPRYDTAPRLQGPVTVYFDNMLFSTPPIPAKGYHVFNEFNSADEVAAWGANRVGNAVPSTVEWDQTVDYADDPNSGSMKITVTWDGTLAREQNRILLQRDNVAGGSPMGLDMREYTWVIARVKPDPAAPKTTWNAFAGGGLVFLNMGSWDPAPAWQSLLATGSQVDSRGWFWIDAFFKAPTAPRRDALIGLAIDLMVFDADNYASGSWSGPATFWIDHIRMGRPQACLDNENCELCNNTGADLVPTDDNGNGLANCDDPDCPGTPACPIETVCDNGMDDDGNGLTDCQDPWCASTATCTGNTPFADADGDGDVDQDDFGAFQACFTGAGVAVGPGCGFWDRDRDLRVDMPDYQVFSDCFSGPNVTASATCGQ